MSPSERKPINMLEKTVPPRWHDHRLVPGMQRFLDNVLGLTIAFVLLSMVTVEGRFGSRVAEASSESSVDRSMRLRPAAFVLRSEEITNGARLEGQLYRRLPIAAQTEIERHNGEVFAVRFASNQVLAQPSQEMEDCLLLHGANSSADISFSSIEISCESPNTSHRLTIDLL